MLKIAHEKWGQSLDDLRTEAIRSSSARTRERFMALYEIACGNANATSLAGSVGRHLQTVIAWVHTYNDHGPSALVFRHTGGWPRPFSP